MKCTRATFGYSASTRACSTIPLADFGFGNKLAALARSSAGVGTNLAAIERTYRAPMRNARANASTVAPGRSCGTSAPIRQTVSVFHEWLAASGSPRFSQRE